MWQLARSHSLRTAGNRDAMGRPANQPNPVDLLLRYSNYASTNPAAFVTASHERETEEPSRTAVNGMAVEIFMMPDVMIHLPHGVVGDLFLVRSTENSIYFGVDSRKQY